MFSLFVGFLCTHLWFLYYTYNNNITTASLDPTDVRIKHKPFVVEFSPILLLCVMVLWLYAFNYLYIQNPTSHQLLWNAIHVSSGGFFYFNFINLIFGVLLLVTVTLVKQSLPVSTEYFIFLLLIVIGGFLLLVSTNLFFTIFALELVALLIFGKFTVTKLFYPRSQPHSNDSTNSFLNNFSYGLFNSLFFQFWANFISSICLFFTLINIHHYYGTSNLYMVNFFFSIVHLSSYTPVNIMFVTVIVFLSGLLIKLGLSPYQFFKIETYKGIPLFTIVNYTTLYLCVYIYFFLQLVIVQLAALKSVSSSYMLIFLGFSTVYLVSLLFDTKNFKAFLSYSTLVTVTNMLVVILIN